MELPESWQFLGPIWWVIHVVGIALVFFTGYLVGRSSMEGPEANVIPPPPSELNQQADKNG